MSVGDPHDRDDAGQIGQGVNGIGRIESAVDRKRQGYQDAAERHGDHCRTEAIDGRVTRDDEREQQRDLVVVVAQQEGQPSDDHGISGGGKDGCLGVGTHEEERPRDHAGREYHPDDERRPLTRRNAGQDQRGGEECDACEDQAADDAKVSLLDCPVVDAPVGEHLAGHHEKLETRPKRIDERQARREPRRDPPLYSTNGGTFHMAIDGEGPFSCGDAQSMDGIAGRRNP
jgi:hypothetical protein